GKEIRRPKEAHRIGKKIGKLVTTRPWAIIVVTVILLSGLAAFVPKMQFTYGLLDSFPDDMNSREGFTIISEHYPPGEIAPVTVVVDTKGEDISFENRLLEHPVGEEVEEAEQGQYKEDYHLWEFTLNINPYSTEAVDSIADFKEETSALLDEAGIEEA